MENKLKMTIDGKTYNVKLEDNELTKEILNLCPFEDEFQRYGEHEYFVKLQKDVSNIKCEKTSYKMHTDTVTSKALTVSTKAYKNKLYYFAGWNAFTY